MGSIILSFLCKDQQTQNCHKQPVIISGASGTGKSILINMFLEDYPNCLEFSISHTTRGPREGETNGKDYHFVTKEKFEEMIKNDEFVEYEKNYENYYGTSKMAIKTIQDNDKIPILDIDSKGLLKVLASKALSKETTVIYVQLSSSKVAEDRLVARGTDSADQIKIRVERYESDVKSIAESDLVTEDQMLLNDVLEDAYAEFKKRILS